MKIKRQAKILEIIEERSIETQDELIRALEETGFRATQAANCSRPTVWAHFAYNSIGLVCFVFLGGSK